jgi:hypothetical protein
MCWSGWRKSKESSALLRWAAFALILAIFLGFAPHEARASAPAASGFTVSAPDSGCGDDGCPDHQQLGAPCCTSCGTAFAVTTPATNSAPQLRHGHAEPAVPAPLVGRCVAPSGKPPKPSHRV